MLYEHAAKASKLGKFLFTEKVTMVNRFVICVLGYICVFISGSLTDPLIIEQLIYEKLPKDISDRHVLLLDPILGTGLHSHHVFLFLLFFYGGFYVLG